MLCEHVAAGIFAVQGSLPETNLTLSKIVSVGVVVNESNTASAMKRSSVPVFTTPSMIAQMECVACECLADCLEDGQTLVGSAINTEHTAASPLGTEATATAAVKYVLGRGNSVLPRATNPVKLGMSLKHE